MNTFDAIEQRRAVKHYDPNYQFSDEEINKLLSSAILSPTSFNIQNWRFVIVNDPALRTKIREASWDQAQVTDSSLLILLCADMKAWNKEPEKYWKDAPTEARDILVPMIKPFYEGKDQLQRDECMRSCGIAAQTLMLSAKSMGYDSCPMIGFDSDAVAKLINLPKDHIITMMLVIGKSTKPANPRGGQLPLDHVVIIDKF